MSITDEDLARYSFRAGVLQETLRQTLDVMRAAHGALKRSRSGRAYLARDGLARLIADVADLLARLDRIDAAGKDRTKDQAS